MKKLSQQFAGCSVLALFFMLLLVNQSIADTARKEVTKRFDLRMGGKIFLKNVSGTIEISSWDKDEVKLRAEITVKHRSRRIADEYLEEVELQFNHGRNYLEIEVDYPHRSGSDRGFISSLFSSLFGRGKPSVTVHFTLVVPEEADLEIHNVNGRIRVSGITGRIKTKTTNGKIEVTESRGAVSCKTVNGSIAVRLEEVSRFDEMYFKTVNGSIRLTIPSDTRANVEASTVNGRINSDLSITVKGKFSRRSLKGKLNGGGGHLILKTVNGSISISEI